MASFTEKSMPLFSHLMTFIGQLLSIFIAPGMIVICLKFCDGQSARYQELFAYSHLFLRYLLASLLVSLVVFVPAFFSGILGAFAMRLADNLPSFLPLIIMILLLILLGAVLLSIRLQFFGYFIVDKNMGAIESIKKSYVLTKGLLAQLFLLFLLLMLINFAGALCFLIGLVATVPTTALAITYVYRKLTREPQVVAAPVAPIV